MITGRHRSSTEPGTSSAHHLPPGVLLVVACLRLRTGHRLHPVPQQPLRPPPRRPGRRRHGWRSRPLPVLACRAHPTVPPAGRPSGRWPDVVMPDPGAPQQQVDSLFLLLTSAGRNIPTGKQARPSALGRCARRNPAPLWPDASADRRAEDADRRRGAPAATDALPAGVSQLSARCAAARRRQRAQPATGLLPPL